MEIKVIFFDAGRVLNDYDQRIFAKAMEKYSPFSKEEIYTKVVDGKPMEKFHRGVLSPKRFFNLIHKDLKFQNVTFPKFKMNWKKVIYFVNYEIEKVLSRIKPGIKLAVISNSNELHWQQNAETRTIKKFFPLGKQRILSHVVGIRKPHLNIFKIALLRYKISARQGIFVDDKERNLKKFRKLGGHTIHYNCRIHSVNYLLKKLESFNVIR